MSDDILEYFPLPKIRPIQEQALLEVFAAFASGKKFVFLEAPPGIGKSALAVALARFYRSAYILTKTIQLQKQYVADFKDARELKGRSNFDCYKLDDLKTPGSCELGGDIFKVRPCVPKVCPYRASKAEALLADLTVCNYMSYLYNIGASSWASSTLQAEQVDDYENWYRPLLILDETHLAEGVMMDEVSITVDIARFNFLGPFVELPPLPNVDDVGSCFAWLAACLERFSTILPGTYEGADEKKLVQLIRKASFAVEHRNLEQWISEPLEHGAGFTLKPLTIRSFAGRLFEFGERVLLMSATILDAEMMAHDLGIDDYAYVCVPSPFPVENREVVSIGLDMAYQSRDRTWPVMVNVISNILGQHEQEKGLILCPSNQMIRFILEGLPDALRARLIVASGSDRVIDYQRHLDAKGPTVLVAPGYWEGADLKDDSSRFQIIPSIPHPPWSGQIRARAELRRDRRWYRMQAYSKLIQGAGRSIRSATDSATTYVLDQRLKKEAQANDSLLPQWFKDSLVFA